MHLSMFQVAVRLFPSCFIYHFQSKLRNMVAVYKGTVNDPTPFPTPSRSAGSHHWAFERLLSAGLVPLTVAAFVTSGTEYPILDGVLGVSLVMHSHIGVRVSIHLSA
jgi:CybS, succinate dehydrogenase cytochrome B small subunit